MSKLIDTVRLYNITSRECETVFIQFTRPYILKNIKIILLSNNNIIGDNYYNICFMKRIDDNYYLMGNNGKLYRNPQSTNHDFEILSNNNICDDYVIIRYKMMGTKFENCKMELYI